ncbi:Transcription factor bHLH25 [Linum perenne]
MDTSKWFNELEMEDYKFFQHCDTINSEVRAELEPPQTQNSASAAALVRKEALQQPCFSSESYSSSGLHHHSNALPNLTILTASGSSINETKISDHHQQPSKQQKLTNSWSSTMKTNHQQQQINFSCNKMLSFHNSKSTTNSDLQPKKECDDFLCQPSTSLMMISNTDPCENTIYDPMGIKTKPFSTSSLTSRTPSHAQDHIMAERKRREKLSQRFIALSSILPGLKKMDKASVLGDAVKYVKHLEEKIKQLEEQSNKRSMESVVMVNRYELIEAEMNHQYCSNPDDHDDNDDNNEEKKKKGKMNGSCLTLPEIEAKTSERDIMIRIHCEKQDGVVAKLMYQVESLNLSILNTTVLPFANSTLHITLIAQMDGEFPMTVKEVVKNLRLAFLKFM